jgi:uncharacterized protein YbjT (DUF2867 family)
MNTLQHIGEAFDIHHIDREPGKIFITGGSGVIGHRIATKLVDVGYTNVRVGTDIKDFLNHMPWKGAKVVDFSWNREETYANALIGIKSVIITIPYQKCWYKHFSVFLKSCQKAGIKHFVKISFCISNVPGTRQIPFVKHHTNCDDMLVHLIMPDYCKHLSHMSYTILSASHFMSNPITYYSMKLNDTNLLAKDYVAYKGHACNYISPNDVAEAAVRVVLSPYDHSNRVYTLLGPKLITLQEIATLMTKYYSKNIEWTDVCLSDYRILLQGTKTPRWMVKDLVSMQQLLTSGFDKDIVQHTQNDFERICGRPPESFTEYFTRTDTMTYLESAITMCT